MVAAGGEAGVNRWREPCAIRERVTRASDPARQATHRDEDESRREEFGGHFMRGRPGIASVRVDCTMMM